MGQTSDSRPLNVGVLKPTVYPQVFQDVDGTYVVLLIEGDTRGADPRVGRYRRFKHMVHARYYLLGVEDGTTATDNELIITDPEHWFDGEEKCCPNCYEGIDDGAFCLECERCAECCICTTGACE